MRLLEEGSGDLWEYDTASLLYLSSSYSGQGCPVERRTVMRYQAVRKGHGAALALTRVLNACRDCSWPVNHWAQVLPFRHPSEAPSGVLSQGVIGYNYWPASTKASQWIAQSAGFREAHRSLSCSHTAKSTKVCQGCDQGRLGT